MGSRAVSSKSPQERKRNKAKKTSRAKDVFIAKKNVV
jgi:hypothetical protein